MRSHVATRSARVALAVTATVALGAGLTACNSDDDKAAAANSSSQPPAATGGTNATGSSTSKSTATGGSGTSGTSGSSSQGSGADQPDSGVGQSCGTNDLDFLVTPSASDGYLLLTATAQPGITCYLDGGTPLVLFSSAEKTKAYPAELMASPAPDSIKLTGSTHAYAVIIPNTTRADSTLTFEEADVTVTAGDPHTAHVTLPGTFTVDEAAVTSWYTTAAAATPNAN